MSAPDSRLEWVDASNGAEDEFLEARLVGPSDWSVREGIYDQDDEVWKTWEGNYESLDMVLDRAVELVAFGGELTLRGLAPRDGAALISSRFTKNHDALEGISVNGQWCEIYNGVLTWEPDLPE